MYFSYEKGSMANVYALDASEVQEIIKMNRNSIKPESLQTEPEPYMPEFITAVGDDSITRFDNPERKRSKRRRGNRQNGGQKKADGQKPQEAGGRKPERTEGRTEGRSEGRSEGRNGGRNDRRNRGRKGPENRKESSE